MKNVFLAWVFLALSCSVFAQNWDVPPGYLNYYSMNGRPANFSWNLASLYNSDQNMGFTDSAGRTNGATLFNNAQSSFSDSTYFNGRNYPFVPFHRSELIIPDYNTISTFYNNGYARSGQLTISFMMYLPSSVPNIFDNTTNVDLSQQWTGGPGGVIINNWYPGSGQSYDPSMGLRLSVNGGTLSMAVNDVEMTTDGTTQQTTPYLYYDARPITLQANKWYHICLVIDAGNYSGSPYKIALYVNGEWRIWKSSNGSGIVPTPPISGYFTIGAASKRGGNSNFNSQLPWHPITNYSAVYYGGGLSNGGTLKPFTGALDEMFVYPYALSDSDINKLYNACTQSPAPTISSYSPITTTVGSTVTIRGANFSSATSVAINGVNATNFNIINPGTIETTLTTDQAVNLNGNNATIEQVRVLSDTGDAILFGKNLPQPKIRGLATACGIAGDSTQFRTYSIDKRPLSTYLWTVSSPNMVIDGSNSLDTVNVWFRSAFTTGVLTVKRINGYDTVTKTLTIAKRIPLAPGLIKGPVNVCSYVGSAAGAPVTYTISPVAGAVSYTWTVPAGWSVNGSGTNVTTSDTSVSITFPSNFTADLIRVASNNACGSSAQRTLGLRTVNPALLYTIAGKNDVCNDMISDTLPNGNAVTFTMRRSPNINSYLWTVPTGATITERPGGEGTSTDTIIKVVFDQTFTGGMVTVRGVSGCFTTLARSYAVTRKLPITRTISVTSTSLTCPSRTFNFGLVATSVATNTRKYLWEVNNGQTISGRDDTTFATVNFGGMASGVYTVRVRGVNNCGFGAYGSRSFTVAICRTPIAQIGRKSAESSEASDLQQTKIFPNPSNSQFQIQLPSDNLKDPVNIRIFDINGKLIEKLLNQKPSTRLIVGQQWKSGVYMVVISQGTKTINEKLIKL